MLILGSQSPRRQEILKYFSVPFESISPAYDESLLEFNGDPAKYVCDLAIGKALSFPISDRPILTADTIVYRDGHVYGKPKSSEEAINVLESLAGAWHSVFTGVSLRKDKEIWVEFEETRILFNEATREQLQNYQTSLHCADKAGGYAVQQAGSILIRKIDGCFYNAMGLPVNAVNTLLSKVGISLWNHLA